MTNGLAQTQDPAIAMIQEVMAMLQSGVTPDELIAQGVPQEIVEAAMMELQASAPVDTPAVTPAGAGLMPGPSGLATQGM